METALVPNAVQFHRAKELITPRAPVYAFGPNEIEKVFGLSLGFDMLPILFTEADLIQAHELNQYLIRQVGTGKDGKPLTVKSLCAQFENKLGDGKLLYNTDWYEEEVFFTTDSPRPGWALVSRDIIPGSAGVNYILQTQALSDYLVGKVYGGQELPAVYQTAVDEFKAHKAELEGLLNTDWRKCAEGLAGLKLNRWFREKPVEVLYGLIVQHEVNHERLLEKTWTWTNQRSSYDSLVYVGYCASDGTDVHDGHPGYSPSHLGVRFFRSSADLVP